MSIRGLIKATEENHMNITYIITAILPVLIHSVTQRICFFANLTCILPLHLRRHLDRHLNYNNVTFPF